MKPKANVAHLLTLLARGQGLDESWGEAGFASRDEAARELESLARSFERAASAPAGACAPSSASAGRPRRDVAAAIAYVDGASRGNPGPSAVAAILYLPSGEELLSSAAKIGRATNNVAEYRAVLEGLRLAQELAVREITIRLDSELVARQLQGRYRIRSVDLAALAEEVARQSRRFVRCRFEHVRREANREADRLANEALSRVVDP